MREARTAGWHDGLNAKGRVLVVDDDPGARSLLIRILAREGIDVLSAENGELALDIVARENPDLLLCDVVMPGLDGFELCRRLKTEPATSLTPVVLITGLGDMADRVRGIDAGADDFLSKPFETVELLARVRSLLRLKRQTDELERAEAVLFTLARSIEGRDPYTHGHCERLATWASALGARMGLDESDVTALRRGGVLHDIGKVTVPDSILFKEGPLSAEERVVVEAHPVVGEHICTPIRSFHRVLPIIRHHHEHMDGSGYPDHLSGDAIPLTARILQVVDVYDALTTERPYRGPLDADAALDVIQREVRQGWWDEGVYEEFTAMVREGLPDPD